MNEAQIFLLAVWSLSMMGAGYGFLLSRERAVENDFFDFVLSVLVPLLALILAAVSVVALITLLASNL